MNQVATQEQGVPYGQDQTTATLNPAFDKYIESTTQKALVEKCEGDCRDDDGFPACTGEVKVYRVIDEAVKSMNDWGFFAYCEAAATEDSETGFNLIEVKQ